MGFDWSDMMDGCDGEGCDRTVAVGWGSVMGKRGGGVVGEYIAGKGDTWRESRGYLLVMRDGSAFLGVDGDGWNHICKATCSPPTQHLFLP